MSRIDDLRKRLEALNRGPLEIRPASELGGEEQALRRRLREGRRRGGAGDGPIVFRRDLPRRAPAPPPVLGEAGPHVELDAAVTDGAPAPDGSGVFIVQRRPAERGAEWEGLCLSLRRCVASRGSGLWPQLEHVGVGGDLRPEDLLFLDLETTGLTSTPLFLVGTMVWEGGGLVTRQFFARDYSQEPAVVEMFLREAAGKRLLVSFNGKTFDVPYVRARAAATGVPCRFDPPHLDLLHAARRAWRARLPDCRLQTLERWICGRTREGDIPGHLIPEAYHEYVRTGNAARMAAVIEHNYLDLLTMADLITRMPPRAGG